MNYKNLYQSTRNKHLTASSAQAILGGIAPDGGLYTLPSFKHVGFDWQALLDMDTLSISAAILSLLLPDFDKDEMRALISASYQSKFETDDLTPTVKVGSDHVLELFHGPTSAFKDIALSVLPRLMCASAKKCGCEDEILVLTATSGDTGKAAMAGFGNVPGTHIMVFYPVDGVSAVQKAQMVTQEGSNVKVCAVRGNFDDAQSGVKHIFTSESTSFIEQSIQLSSANSINIGRLTPQIVYYFAAYAALVKDKTIQVGERVDFSVPTGNFGDILAGFIARELGLPIGKLICASNANNVLTEFLHTGYYDRKRPFHLTTSPSMDILISSNLERLLFLLSEDEALVASLMKQLNEQGHYQISRDLLLKIQDLFWAGCCTDDETRQTIGNVWQENGYLCDTHTAVAWHVAQQYKQQNPAHNPVVILSTASPYKFPEAVLAALDAPKADDGFAAIRSLHALTDVPIPQNLASLHEKIQRHFDVIDPDEMLAYVRKYAEEMR